MTNPHGARSRAVRILFAVLAATLLQVLSTSPASAHITSAVANVTTHTFTVEANGELREMPASMGKPGHETPLGTFEVLEKDRNLVMDSSTYGVPIDSPEGYRVDTEYAVRLTWSGIFVHAAPWSVQQQGYENVSHGCINLSTENAQWFYDNVEVGDLVTIVG